MLLNNMNIYQLILHSQIFQWQYINVENIVT